jgi:hypothetical protein
MAMLDWDGARGKTFTSTSGGPPATPSESLLAEYNRKGGGFNAIATLGLMIWCARNVR